MMALSSGDHFTCADSKTTNDAHQFEGEGKDSGDDLFRSSARSKTKSLARWTSDTQIDSSIIAQCGVK
jgi:hypothetical protein